MKEYIVKVNSQEEFKQVEEKAYQLGYKWKYSPQNALFKTVFRLSKNGVIYHSCDDNPTISLQQLLKLGESKVKNYYVVNCMNSVICAEVQKQAFSVGYQWLDGKTVKPLKDPRDCILRFSQEGKITYCDSLDNVNCTIEEFFKVDIRPMIGEYPVEKTSTGIRVGCQEISMETIEKIYAYAKSAT